jgi:hypothetical protein
MFVSSALLVRQRRNAKKSMHGLLHGIISAYLRSVVFHQSFFELVAIAA